MEVYEGKIISMTREERNQIDRFNTCHIAIVNHAKLMVDVVENTCNIQCSFNKLFKGQFIQKIRNYARNDESILNDFIEIFEREDIMEDQMIVVRCSIAEFNFAKQFVYGHVEFTDLLDNGIDSISGERSCTVECRFNTHKRTPLTIQARNLINQARETVNPLIALFDQEIT